MRWFLYHFFALVLAAAPALADSDVGARGHSARTKSAPLAPGFFVSPTGNDSNPGTLALPFLTLGQAQTAMRNSGTIKTTYVRAGHYYPAGVGTSCNGGLTSSLVLTTPNDDGVTIQYYPPDGYLSAQIDGGAVTNTGLGCGIFSSANNIIIAGLWFMNYRAYPIETTGSKPLIINNRVDGVTDSVIIGTAGIVTQDAANGQIVHNIVTKTVCHGIASFPQTAHGVDNLLVANNYLFQVSTAHADCGGIYMENNHSFATFTQTGEILKYNYVQDTNLGGGANCLYIDDMSSSFTLLGNVCRSGGTNGYPCFFIHGGNSNTNTGLICDEATDTNKQILTVQASADATNGTTAAGNATLHFSFNPPSWWVGTIVTDVTSPTVIPASTTILSVGTGIATMSANATGAGVGNGDSIQHTNGTAAPTGNTLTASLILSNLAGANVGGGYPCNAANCGTTTIGPNAYQNYTGTSILSTGSAGNDSNPQQQIAPNFTCGWTYVLPANSPVYNSPVNYPVQPAAWGTPGFWGPPGFTPPQTGTAPSPPPSTC